MESYLAYRRDGGQSYEWGAKWCAGVARAIQTAQPSSMTELARQLGEYLDTEAGPRAKRLMPKLQAILAGGRDLALADDPALRYDDAVELTLLLESLAAK
jgi:hypothetical protein